MANWDQSMSSIYPYQSFALRRVNNETSRWVATLRGACESLRQASEQVQDACGVALARIDEARAAQADIANERRADHQRVMDVLNRQILDEMIAERDRLRAKLNKQPHDACD